jgi:uncharacterized protein YgfB (UPF0149 family)
VDAPIPAKPVSTSGSTVDGLPDPSDVALALRAAGAVVDPSELHGALCGFIAGGGRVRTDWLHRLQIEVDEEPAPGTTLDDLRVVTVAQFEADDFGLQLLMPADDAPLPGRAEGLVAWCRGFLGGFGLAAPPPGVFSAESTEALQDLGRIAASESGEEDSETEEAALAELVEFARVAALLMHGDCVRGAQRRRRAN